MKIFQVWFNNDGLNKKKDFIVIAEGTNKREVFYSAKRHLSSDFTRAVIRDMEKRGDLFVKEYKGNKEDFPEVSFMRLLMY